MRTPSADKTSALPQRLLMARFPCLATVAPAPAATNATAVEMLNRTRPVAAGAADVEQGSARALHRHHPIAQCCGSTRQLVCGFAARRKGGEQGADLRGRCVAVHDGLDRQPHVRHGQSLAANGAPNAIGHRLRCRLLLKR